MLRKEKAGERLCTKSAKLNTHWRDTCAAWLARRPLVRLCSQARRRHADENKDREEEQSERRRWVGPATAEDREGTLNRLDRCRLRRYRCVSPSQRVLATQPTETVEVKERRKADRQTGNRETASMDSNVWACWRSVWWQDGCLRV